MIVLSTLPDQLIIFFHGGPSSWNGVFGLWIPVTTFGIFFVMSFVVLRKAVLRERARILQAAPVSNALSAT